MNLQLELLLQSVRPIIRRDGQMSAPSSPKFQIFKGEINKKKMIRTLTPNRRRKSSDDLLEKRRMTEDEMRRFYSRGRRPSNTRHNSSGNTGSTGSNDNTNQGRNCNLDVAPHIRSRSSTPDNIRRSHNPSGCRNNETISPRLTRQNSIDEKDNEKKRQNCKDLRVRLVLVCYCLS